MANTVEHLDGTSIIGTAITVTSMVISGLTVETNLKLLMYAVTIVAGLTTILINIKKLKAK